MKRTAFMAALCLAADGLVGVADVLAKRWLQGAGFSYVVGSYLLCSVATGLWFIMLRTFGNLGRSAVIWNATGVAAALAIAFWMGERPSGLNWAGMALALAGIILTAV
jgi:multidrug transporter EmrE-like cation transporter